jgi:hypothetical protein
MGFYNNFFVLFQSKVALVEKAIAACGSTPENVAKIIMIENQLSKKGAQSRFIADALKHLGDFEAKKEDVIASITKAFSEDKLKRDDVFLTVRMCQAIESENEPTWKEVKTMKDILAGCSPSSPEGIELNLARATKVNQSARATAESARATAESARATAESARTTAESARATASTVNKSAARPLGLSSRLLLKVFNSVVLDDPATVDPRKTVYKKVNRGSRGK